MNKLLTPVALEQVVVAFTLLVRVYSHEVVLVRVLVSGPILSGGTSTRLQVVVIVGHDFE
jgi:hypothetical protein